ncbi:hypothetical protein, partial [Xenorhabdus griffiniae]|uniref:hypothetical protein n=1 Tax=Xenorhabdus griffiniae TaxID=351672 RepID=UPI001CB92D70
FFVFNKYTSTIPTWPNNRLNELLPWPENPFSSTPLCAYLAMQGEITGRLRRKPEDHGIFPAF